MPATASAQKLLELAARLPAAARILSSLQILLVDPNTSLEDVCALIKLDMALTARAISISNSAYYGLSAKNSSLEEAVGYVGFNEVYKLVAITVATQMAQDDLRFYRCSALRLWENTMAHALAMEALAQFAGIHPRHAYTAGMMRSLGKSVLEMFAREALAPSQAFDPSAGQTLEAWEHATFGCDSAAVGARVLRTWHFPEEICAAVEGQRHPAGKGALLLYLSTRVVHELGLDLPGEDSLWEKPDAADLAAAGFGETEMRLAWLQAKAMFERLQLALQQPAKISAPKLTAALAAK
ncbi:MAG TPA: HDOD domain-containing protein [Opitutaceae bacterium]|jgi:HD-like signal output (HDOD) protein|nr:HDOD domain-containing protein [Opitutaceae bacterium]